MTIGLLIQQGIQALQGGHFKAAQKSFQKVLKADKRNADAHNLLGVVALQNGKPQEAIKWGKKALTLSPNQPMFLQNLATAHQALSQWSEMAQCYQTILDLDPKNAEAAYMAGMAYLSGGKPDDAVTAFESAEDLGVTEATLKTNKGQALIQADRLAEAENLYKDLQSAGNSSADVLLGLAMVARKKRHFAEALELYRQAQEADPAHPLILAGLGLCCRELGDLEQAINWFEKALAVQPESYEALMNMGTTQLSYAGNPAEGLRYLDKCQKLFPKSQMVKWNQSLGLIAQGQYAKGWRLYESRFTAGVEPKRPFPYKEWNGRSIKEGSLILWGEQGVGDEVYFARLFSKAMTEARQPVHVECDARLVPLFERSFDGLTGHGRTEAPAAALQDLPGAKQLAAASLPTLFIKSDKDITGSAFLKADPDQTQALREKYQGFGANKPVIGISWRSQNVENGQLRSVKLLDWQPILSAAEATFVNLQYGDVTEDLATLKEQTGLTVHHDPTIDPLKDLDGFASQVAAMDLVISVDNSTVHFAGALGIATWVLLTDAPDFRWPTGQDKTPWYDSLTLYRKSDHDTLAALIRSIAAKLSGHFQG